MSEGATGQSTKGFVCCVPGRRGGLERRSPVLRGKSDSCQEALAGERSACIRGQRGDREEAGQDGRLMQGPQVCLSQEHGTPSLESSVP